jgi:hypothetical protein
MPILTQSRALSWVTVVASGRQRVPADASRWSLSVTSGALEIQS